MIKIFLKGKVWDIHEGSIESERDYEHYNMDILRATTQTAVMRLTIERSWSNIGLIHHFESSKFESNKKIKFIWIATRTEKVRIVGKIREVKRNGEMLEYTIVLTKKPKVTRRIDWEDVRNG